MMRVRKLPTMLLSDSAVIGRSLHDPHAFALIFDRHFARIHSYLARRAGVAVADDVASEVFTVAFARRGAYDLDRTDALPWLYGIASNLLHAAWRAQRREVELPKRHGPPDEDAPFDAAVIAQADPERERPALRALLAELSPEDATTLLLYAWEDLTYAQIAEALAIPTGTVRSRLNRIRRIAREPDGPLAAISDDTDEPEGRTS